MKKSLHKLIILCLLFASIGIAEAATTVTINLKNSSGSFITSGATLSYYDGGWQTATDNNNGTFTANVNGASIIYKMTYNYTSQTITSTDPTVNFTTVATTAIVKNSDGTTLSGGTYSYYGIGGWHYGYNAGDVLELLPGSYSFSMRYNNSSQQKNGQVVSGQSTDIVFTTVTVTPRVLDCDDNDIAGGEYNYYSGGWSSTYNSNTSVEILPGNYSFAMTLNGSRNQKNGVTILGTNAQQDVPFYATQMNYVYGGNISYYAGGWRSYNQGMYLLPGTIYFKFGNNTFPHFEVSGCSMDGNLNIFYTKKADGTPLPNITIKRNDYGNHYKTVGTTDANGLLFSTDQPDGIWNYRADKNYSYQTILSGPNTITFQTCNFTAHVKHTDGSDFEGVETEYNDYGNHWIDLLPQYTDASGNASIELFAGDYKFRAKKNYSYLSKNLELTSPGSSGVVEFQTATYKAHVTKSNGDDFEGIATEYNDYGNHWIDLSPQYTDANGNAIIELFPGEYTFRAKKNYSYQSKTHEILTSGTTESIEFQTSEYIAHVMKHDGSPLEGVATEYNDYGNHWFDLSPNVTDANGNASIELFPGDYTFRAVKNYSRQVKNLNIATSGISDIVNFQTALAEGYARDCDLDAGVAGISFEYNDYGNHWTDLSPQVTGNDGLASIELFPGTYDIRAKIHYTYLTKTVTLTGPITQTEYNPVRVNLNYAGTVRYNDYGNHWMTMTPNTYMFPGTYDFRFYTGSTIDHQQSIVINGCKVDESLIFVQLQDSHNNGLAGGDFDTRIGYGGYTNLGIDASGNGYWAFVNGHPSYTKVRVSYLGGKQEIQQNITVNPVFIFNTVNVIGDLLSSTNAPLTADSWEYRYGYGAYHTFTNAGQEFLPTYLKIRVGYNGTHVEKQQNVGTNAHFEFNTVNVIGDLLSSTNAPLTADSWEYRYGYGAYHPFTNTGQEFLPAYMKIRVGYKGALKEKQQNVGTNAHFVFNTLSVTGQLLSSTNASLTADSWEYRYGYGTYQTFDPNGEELLPVNVKVRVGYKGTHKEKQQNVSTMPNYVFNTVNATADLKSSTGTALTGTASWKYRYGYGTYQTFDPNGEELLPVYTKVKVYYKGACVEKQQNLSTNTYYTFNTIKVTADLKDNTGSPLVADTWNYRYGYGTYQTFDPNGEELLPKKVKVKATYNGKSKEKYQNPIVDADFSFTWDGSSLYKSTSEDFGGVLAKVKVYPNPSDGKFMIENISGYDNLTIYDMTGRLIYSRDIVDVNNMNILLDNPVSGAYVIKLNGVNGSINTPLMIK